MDSSDCNNLFHFPSVHLEWARVQKGLQFLDDKVFLSTCSNILSTVMSVLEAVLPEGLKVTAV